MDIASRFQGDQPEFHAALAFTARETGFRAALIEEDYYCSLILRDLRDHWDHLVFKGGTSLCKVHAGFYRLSEDLDFHVSIDANAHRRERRKRVLPLKDYFNRLPSRLPCFRAQQGQQELLRGHDASRHYICEFLYQSVITNQTEKVKAEISLREPALEQTVMGRAKTLTMNPFTGAPMFDAIPVRTLSRHESYAEKFRAALTRRPPAIRDLYDIGVAQESGFDASDDRFVELARRKLEILRVDSAVLSEQRIVALKEQMEGQLKPVLRGEDYNKFDLDKALAIVSEVAGRL